jgi:hypothetical protein
MMLFLKKKEVKSRSLIKFFTQQKWEGSGKHQGALFPGQRKVECRQHNQSLFIISTNVEIIYLHWISTKSSILDYSRSAQN